MWTHNVVLAGICSRYIHFPSVRQPASLLNSELLLFRTWLFAPGCSLALFCASLHACVYTLLLSCELRTGAQDCNLPQKGEFHSDPV